MINSPEVHLGMKWSYPEFGHKNLYILSYKNHLDRFIINTKYIILKYLLSKFVQFLVLNLAMA
jgi:hypothetical protein